MDTQEKLVQSIAQEIAQAKLETEKKRATATPIQIIKKFRFLIIGASLIVANSTFLALDNYDLINENNALKIQIKTTKTPTTHNVKYSEFEIIDAANHCDNGLIQSIGDTNFCRSI